MRKTAIVLVILVLVVWGLWAPPGGERSDPFGKARDNWGDGKLRLQLRDLVDGRLVDGARVRLSTPGGRQLEARSDARGRVEFPLFLLDDFLFRIMIEHRSYEGADYRLRGADLARHRRQELLLVPVGGRVDLRGRLRCRDPVASAARLRYRWWFPGSQIRPGGRDVELTAIDPVTGDFVIPGLPRGARFEVEAWAEVETPGLRGLAALRRRGFVGPEEADLGELVLKARTVTGALRDRDGNPLKLWPLTIRLEGWTGLPTMRLESDGLGDYVCLLPEGEERLSGRASLGRGRERIVELPWSAEGERAGTLVWPRPAPVLPRDG